MCLVLVKKNNDMIFQSKLLQVRRYSPWMLNSFELVVCCSLFLEGCPKMSHLKPFCKIYINVLKCPSANFNLGSECLCGFIFTLTCVYLMINLNHIINLTLYMCTYRVFKQIWKRNSDLWKWILSIRNGALEYRIINTLWMIKNISIR